MAVGSYALASVTKHYNLVLPRGQRCSETSTNNCGSGVALATCQGLCTLYHLWACKHKWAPTLAVGPCQCHGVGVLEICAANIWYAVVDRTSLTRDVQTLSDRSTWAKESTSFVLLSPASISWHRFLVISLNTAFTLMTRMFLYCSDDDSNNGVTVVTMMKWHSTALVYARPKVEPSFSSVAATVKWFSVYYYRSLIVCLVDLVWKQLMTLRGWRLTQNKCG